MTGLQPASGPGDAGFADAGFGFGDAGLADAGFADARPGEERSGDAGFADAGPGDLAVPYRVHLPPGYDPSGRIRYITVYLLHGRGRTAGDWAGILPDVDDLISSGAIPPVITVLPDAPWNNRGHWYTDSHYTGNARTPEPGHSVETAFTRDLIAHIDDRYPTVADRAGRVVGGYSMGGAAALRYTLAYPEIFGAGIVLSPAVYVTQPPADSWVRAYGAYGVGPALFDPERYAALNYPAALAAYARRDPVLAVRLCIAVGDGEWAHPDPADACHDLDFEAAKLYNAARRVRGITAHLRVLDGGHDWPVWRPALREALVTVLGVPG